MKISIDSLVIETTQKCNMQCYHCLRGAARRNNTSRQMINRIFDLFNGYISTLTVGGGEPSMNIDALEDIQDNMICLGGHKYRAVIEASSTNYNLKTDREKEIIELSFQRFINSLTFPITFFIQTKVLDNSKMLNQLENELAETVDKYPQMKE